MQESIKKSRKEPVFLLEMPELLSHLIMKRGQMLRGRRTRTLCYLGKGGSKSWLEAKLIPSPGESTEESWDKAHDLAARFKCELHSDVYVEPAGEHGRFKELISPTIGAEPADSDDFLYGYPGGGSGLGASMGSFLVPGMPSAFGDTINGHNSGRSNPFGMGMGNANLPGMPHIQDPIKELLPPQVRQAMGMGGTSGGATDKGKRLELEFPALRELPGWSALPEGKQKMFEVEAAQLSSGGLLSPDNKQGLGDSDIRGLPVVATFGDDRALAALTTHPKISAALKCFLLGRFEAATRRQCTAAKS
jgi:hypothetical protein